MANMVLVTAFIDGKGSRIEMKSQQIISKQSHAGAILANFEDVDAVLFSDGIMTSLVWKYNSNPAWFWAAKNKLMLPNSKVPVLVQAEETRAYMVEAALTANDEKRLSIAKVTVET